MLKSQEIPKSRPTRTLPQVSLLTIDHQERTAISGLLFSVILEVILVVSFTCFNRLLTSGSFFLRLELIGVELSLWLPKLRLDARKLLLSSEGELNASLQLFLRPNLGDTARVVGS